MCYKFTNFFAIHQNFSKKIPDNENELHPKSWTQNFWGALCIDTITLKNG